MGLMKRITFIVFTIIILAGGILFASNHFFRREEVPPPTTIPSLMLTERLDPKIANPKISLDQAIESVKKIWQVPQEGELRTYLSRNHKYDITIWDLVWEMDRNAIIMAEVNADTGEVLLILDFRREARKDNLKDKAKAVVIGLEMLKKIEIPIHELLKPEVSVNKLGEEITYQILWWQGEEGVSVLGGFVLVTIDPETLKPVGFTKRLFNTEGINIKPSIPKEEAVIKAKEFIDYLNQLEKSKVTAGKVTEVKLAIGRPTPYWKEDQIRYGKLTLVWVVTLERLQPHPGLIYIWVDAHTGEVVGGDQTR